MNRCFHCNTVAKPGMNRCSSCGKWNFSGPDQKERMTILSHVNTKDNPRIKSGPWDTCFGGGISPTTVTLLAGEPGAGKSTLLLQIADNVGYIAPMGQSWIVGPSAVMYIATEENEEQIKERADRMKLKFQEHILIVNAMGGMNLDGILNEMKPKLVILDSLPGFTGKGTNKDEAIQIIKVLKKYAEDNHAPAIVTDHITKDLDFAGYMSLMHAVDCLLMFKRTINKRILVTEKNRNGKAPETVSFEMTECGLIQSQD